MARAVDRDAKRLKILEASTRRFAQSGFDATSMDDLALAAGVSKGSLYDYFRNKEDLFYACFEWFEAQLLAASMARLAEQSDAKARLIGFADTSVQALQENIALYPVMLEVWAAAAKSGTRERFSQAMRTLYAQFRAQVSTLVRSAQASGDLKPDVDAEALAGMMIGAVDGLLLQYWLDPSFDPRAWVKSFMNSLFSGIGS
ncbi:MAG: TetR/AcrR family transcriptional regulator [Alphaproteobacteria bacterium]|nr:TetR/AcrR family transcriptional regulator [Alphaproteobacteria bacterium]